MTPSVDNAMSWLRSRAIRPGEGQDPRSAAASPELDRRAIAMRAAFSGEVGQLALQTILELTLFRPPVDMNLQPGPYLRFAQNREGQNQVAAAILAYLDHAETLERTPRATATDDVQPDDPERGGGADWIGGSHADPLVAV